MSVSIWLPTGEMFFPRIGQGKCQVVRSGVMLWKRTLTMGQSGEILFNLRVKCSETGSPPCLKESYHWLELRCLVRILWCFLLHKVDSHVCGQACLPLIGCGERCCIWWGWSVLMQFDHSDFLMVARQTCEIYTWLFTDPSPHYVCWVFLTECSST